MFTDFAKLSTFFDYKLPNKMKSTQTEELTKHAKKILQEEKNRLLLEVFSSQHSFQKTLGNIFDRSYFPNIKEQKEN